MAFLLTEVIRLSVRKKDIKCTVYPSDEVSRVIVKSKAEESDFVCMAFRTSLIPCALNF